MVSLAGIGGRVWYCRTSHGPPPLIGSGPGALANAKTRAARVRSSRQSQAASKRICTRCLHLPQRIARQARDRPLSALSRSLQLEVSRVATTPDCTRGQSSMRAAAVIILLAVGRVSGDGFLATHISAPPCMWSVWAGTACTPLLRLRGGAFKRRRPGAEEGAAGEDVPEVLVSVPPERWADEVEKLRLRKEELKEVFRRTRARTDAQALLLAQDNFARSRRAIQRLAAETDALKRPRTTVHAHIKSETKLDAERSSRVISQVPGGGHADPDSRALKERELAVLHELEQPITEAWQQARGQGMERAETTAPGAASEPALAPSEIDESTMQQWTAGLAKALSRQTQTSTADHPPALSQVDDAIKKLRAEAARGEASAEDVRDRKELVARSAAAALAPLAHDEAAAAALPQAAGPRRPVSRHDPRGVLWRSSVHCLLTKRGSGEPRGASILRPSRLPWGTARPQKEDQGGMGRDWDGASTWNQSLETQAGGRMVREERQGGAVEQEQQPAKEPASVKQQLASIAAAIASLQVSFLSCAFQAVATLF